MLCGVCERLDLSGLFVPSRIALVRLPSLFRPAVFKLRYWARNAQSRGRGFFDRWISRVLALLITPTGHFNGG